MSSDIAWAITRNNSAYLLKMRGAPKPFSTDPLNLTNKNSQRYNGYLHKKAVGVTRSADNKGFTMTTKRSKLTHRPAKTLAKTDMKAGARSSLHKMRAMMVKQRYRKDLTKAAVKRASAIIRSQKPLPTRKGAKVAVAKKAAE